jgi:hypothetical protein
MPGNRPRVDARPRGIKGSQGDGSCAILTAHADGNGQYELKVLAAGRRLILFVSARGFGSEHFRVNTSDASTNDFAVRVHRIVTSAPSFGTGSVPASPIARPPGLVTQNWGQSARTLLYRRTPFCPALKNFWAFDITGPPYQALDALVESRSDLGWAIVWTGNKANTSLVSSRTWITRDGRAVTIIGTPAKSD